MRKFKRKSGQEKQCGQYKYKMEGQESAKYQQEYKRNENI